MVNPEHVLVTRTEIGGGAKGYLGLENVHKSSKVAYKVKTTAPNLFAVKPIMGVIEVDETVEVKVQLYATQAKDEDAMKNKFMIQAAKIGDAPMDMAVFWEDMKVRKAEIRSKIMKVNIVEDIRPEGEPKLKKKKTKF